MIEDVDGATTADAAGGSVTRWIGNLQRGGDAAAQPLWEHYFQRLVGLARARLGAVPRRMADEEDVALEAFQSFLAGAARGRFPQLHDRADIWRLLVVLTVRKAERQIRRETRLRRGGGRVLDESALTSAGGDRSSGGLAENAGREPTPELAAILAEECRLRIESLRSERERQVALLRMEGYSIVEIAVRLGMSKATVDRKLDVIRKLWLQGEAS